MLHQKCVSSPQGGSIAQARSSLEAPLRIYGGGRPCKVIKVHASRPFAAADPGDQMLHRHQIEPGEKHLPVRTKAISRRTDCKEDLRDLGWLRPRGLYLEKQPVAHGEGLDEDLLGALGDGPRYDLVILFRRRRVPLPVGVVPGGVAEDINGGRREGGSRGDHPVDVP